jgi:hypothetical protein
VSEDRKFRWDEERKAFVNRVSGEAIPDDEPVILFRARDRHTQALLNYYQSLVKDDHHWRAVQDRIEEFAEFRANHPERMKEPGITRHIRLNSETDQ